MTSWLKNLGDSNEIGTLYVSVTRLFWVSDTVSLPPNDEKNLRFYFKSKIKLICIYSLYRAMMLLLVPIY
jgi:hypothetical protein